MTNEDFGGIINPYALAEDVAGRPIPWSRVGDTRKVLEALLGQPYERLFAPEGLLMTGAVNNPDGTVTVLDAAARRQQIASMIFDDGRRASALQYLADRSKLSVEAVVQRFNATDEAVRSALLETPADEVSKSTPWTPADKEWVDKGTFFAEAAEYSDPVQGKLGDCYFIAPLSAVAWTMPELIAQSTRSTGTDQQQFHDVVCFYQNGDRQHVEASEKVPVKAVTHHWVYARSAEIGEIWPAMYEKLYAKWKTGNTTDQPDYTVLAGGSGVTALAELTGKSPSSHATTDYSAEQLFALVKGNCDSKGKAKIPMVAGTYPSDAATPDHVVYDDVNIVRRHIYTVLGCAEQDGYCYIILRNPWAKHEATGNATLSGTWNGITLGTKGVFGLEQVTFKRYYKGLGWVD